MAIVPQDVLGMSDEDFLKANGPESFAEQADSAPGTGETSAATEGTGEQETEAGTEDADDPAAADAGQAPDEQGAGKEPALDGSLPKDTSQGQESAAPATDADGSQGTAAPDKASGGDAATGAAPAGSQAEAALTPPNYEEFYKKVMTPFKANGKTFSLRSPEEAVRLMQQGANYTRKMQELAPHRKVLLMLENNGLLDEGKLSFLIDIEKKNPEAIRKLVKDAGIDPLEIDTSTPAAYQAGNHRVTDEEVAFTGILDDLKSTPEGVATIQTISTDWDQASKEALLKTPELMSAIHDQRSNGIYDAITTEMDRRRTLGMLPANAHFLAAYKQIGDELNEAGAFGALAAPASPAVVPLAQQAAPVTVRIQAPKPAAANGTQAQAAAPSRATPAKATGFINPLAMSDEEFLKQAPPA